MEEKLAWAFELSDRMSGSASKMSKAVITLKEKLEDGSTATVKLTRDLKKVGEEASRAGTFGLGNLKSWASMGAAAVLTFGAATAYASVEFGRFAVDALAFKESTLASFKLMLGTEEKAKSIFDEALAFGKLTPFETEDVVNSYKELMSAGFTQAEVPIVFQALGDVAAASGFKKEAMGMITTQLAQVRGVGKLQMMDLKQIVGWTAPAGVGLQKVYEQIAKLRGISAQAVPALLSSGQIKSDEGIFAIISAIKEVSGGKVGNTMLAQSQTLKGLFSTLESAPKDFFLSMNLEDLPGITSFKGFIIELIRLFDTTSATGSRLQSVLKDTFNNVFSELFGGDVTGGLEWGLTNAITIIEAMGNLVRDFIVMGKGFWEAFAPGLEMVMPLITGVANEGQGATDVARNLGLALGAVASGAVIVMTLPLRIQQEFSDFTTWWFRTWESLGKSVGDGLKEGILGSGSGVMGVITNLLTGGVIGTAQALLDTHSPSRVFQQMGIDTMRGYALGVEGATDAARRSVVEGIAPPTLRSGVLGGGRVEVNVTVPITVSTSSGETAAAVERELRELLPPALTAVFKQLNTETGA